MESPIRAEHIHCWEMNIYSLASELLHRGILQVGRKGNAVYVSLSQMSMTSLIVPEGHHSALISLLGVRITHSGI